MNSFTNKQLYDGLEDEKLYNTLIVDNTDLSDVLRDSMSALDAENLISSEFMEYIKSECNNKYVQPYFYKSSQGIIAIGFGETQPARYQLFIFGS